MRVLLLASALLGATTAAQAQHAGDQSAMAVGAFPEISPAPYLRVGPLGEQDRATGVMAQLRSVCAERTEGGFRWSINQRNARRCAAGKAAFGEGYVAYQARAVSLTQLDTTAAN